MLATATTLAGNSPPTSPMPGSIPGFRINEDCGGELAVIAAAAFAGPLIGPRWASTPMRSI